MCLVTTSMTANISTHYSPIETLKFSNLERTVALSLHTVALIQATLGFLLITIAIHNKKLLGTSLMLVTLATNDFLCVMLLSTVSMVTLISNSWLFGDIFCWMQPIYLAVLGKCLFH